MSLHAQARKLIDQAQAAIQSGNAQYATELLRQSIMYNGKDAEAFLLLGIALAQMKMPGDAENAFLKATKLDPNHVKARYNLAVHQYTEGQVRAALENARLASEMDTRHVGSADLARRIEQELGIGPGEMPKTTAAGNPTPAPYREGYQPQEVQTVPFIERLGFRWTLVGFAIALLSLAGLIITLSVVWPDLGSNLGRESLATTWTSNPTMRIAQVLGFGSNILGLAWIGIDAVNRRGNLLWLLPQAFCGCIGFTFVVLPLYIFLGRKPSA